MNLDQHQEGPVLVVRILDKRLDARAAPDLKRQIAGLIGDGHLPIALNLGVVEFIDSSGLGTLVSILKQIGDGGDLAIASARETITTMFKLTRLDRVFRMYGSDGDALAAMAA